MSAPDPPSILERLDCLERYVGQLGSNMVWARDAIVGLCRRPQKRISGGWPRTVPASGIVVEAGTATRHRRGSSTASPLNLAVVTGTATRHRRGSSTAHQSILPVVTGTATRHRRGSSTASAIGAGLVANVTGTAIRHRRGSSSVSAFGFSVLGVTGSATRHRRGSSSVTRVVTAIYGQRWSCWPEESIVTVGTAIAVTLNAGQRYGYYTQRTAPAIGDAQTIGFTLAAGTYTLTILAIKSTAYGQVDVYIDGVTVLASQDYYAAVPALNNIVTVGVTIVGNGYHVLTTIVSGKNVASTGYFFTPTKYWFSPATDTPNHD